MALLQSPMPSFLFSLLLSVPLVISAGPHSDFLQCFQSYPGVSNITYTPTSPSYTSILQFSIRNPRFNLTSTPKPQVIVTPKNESHIQATINCSISNNMHLRIRSGGHDYEGLSYVSRVPFVILDMINLRTITVDVANKTAWAQAGATNGELYHAIAQASKTLAFPAGICTTLGLGGHISGGGIGMISRKYGLAADNVIDAKLIDVKGRVLDRAAMGEDLFWAIRGGGGNTFGVVIAWKLNLVDVPPTVTLFNVLRNVDQNATKIINAWQTAANKLPPEVLLPIFLNKAESHVTEGDYTVQASFPSVYLGGIDTLLPLMQKSFPELGLTKQDCAEMSWIESVLATAGFPRNSSLDVLLNRTPLLSAYFKAKSDFVKKPMTETALKGIFDKFLVDGIETPRMILTPYGAIMEKIPESTIPFPHRAGNIYYINYLSIWRTEGDAASQKHIDWIRNLYDYMTPYVSQNPREAYINHRDLDIGLNTDNDPSSFALKYFKNNFKRLATVKAAVDPGNFFRNEQSVLPASS